VISKPCGMHGVHTAYTADLGVKHGRNSITSEVIVRRSRPDKVQGPIKTTGDLLAYDVLAFQL